MITSEDINKHKIKKEKLLTKVDFDNKKNKETSPKIKVV